MYICEHMTSPVITVTSDTLIHEAWSIMQDNDIRRLPVVDSGKLVGLITQDRLRDAEPPTSSGLSMWDVHHSLATMRVSHVMARNVTTVKPDDTVEEACVLAQEKGISTLPVVDETGKLIGITTITDLYRITNQALGFGEKGVRLHIMHPDTGVVTCHVMEILCKHQADVLCIFPVTPAGSPDKHLVIHLATEAADPIVEDIRKLGYHVDVRRHRLPCYCG